jgi:hypothetical protein
MGWLSKQSVNTLVSVCNTGTYLRGGKYDNDTTQITWDEYLESNPAKCMLGKPVSYISMSTGRIGLGYTDHHIMSYSEYTYIICWLYIIEYASFYSQETYNSQSTTDGYKQGGLGAGVTDLSSTNWSNLNSYYPVTPNGYTNDLGNGTGIKALKYTVSDKEYTTYVCRWRGFENPFGDTWQFVDGVMCHKNAVTTDSTTTYPTSTWYICDDPTYFTSSTNLSAYDNIYWRKVECPINSSGWPNNFFFGSDPTPDSSNDQITIGGWFGDLIPISLGGSASTGTTDYFYTSNNVFCCLIFGGYARSGTDAGLLYFDVLSSLDLVHTHVVIRGAINPKSSS